MHGTLNENEPHPAAEGARQWLIKYIQRKDPYALFRLQESFASCAIEGNRLAEMCSETLRRLLAKEPVSDRYLLGLVWTIRDMEEKEQMAGADSASFQDRVKPWMDACFGPVISADKSERNHRFLEEALELVQASGCSREECLQLVDYVYGRPQGDVNQEVGGVMVTLAAHCLAHGVDMHEAAEVELARIWTKIDQIRAKQAAKPRGSVLPISPSYLPAPAADEPHGFRPIESAPKDGTPIVVGHLVRYLPYKPDGKRQMKKDGRWQEWNGYGWSNIDWEPDEWRPAKAKPTAEAV